MYLIFSKLLQHTPCIFVFKNSRTKIKNYDTEVWKHERIPTNTALCRQILHIFVSFSVEGKSKPTIALCLTGHLDQLCISLISGMEI
jgi:hypothetical protein